MPSPPVTPKAARVTATPTAPRKPHAQAPGSNYVTPNTSPLAPEGVRGRVAEQYTVHGITRSLTAWAQTLCVSPATLRAQLRQGHTLEQLADALGSRPTPELHGLDDRAPMIAMLSQVHERDGQTLNVWQWAQFYGVDSSVFTERLRARWSFDEVCRHIEHLQAQLRSPAVINVPPSRFSPPSPDVPINVQPSPPRLELQAALLCPRCTDRARQYYEQIHLGHMAEQLRIEPLMQAYINPAYLTNDAGAP